MKQKLWVNVPESDLQEVLCWLEGALKCKNWDWSPDQYELACSAYERLAPKAKLPPLFQDPSKLTDR